MPEPFHAVNEQQLLETMERSRSLGFLGPGPIEEHVVHARHLGAALKGSDERFVDLGSGGGLPGLVIAVEHPQRTGVLLDASARRTQFLREAVLSLGLQDRITVYEGRAEHFGHSPEQRSAFDAVLARSFGPPAVVAECAAPLLRVGGRLIVSDPPAGGSLSSRWPADGLEQLGLVVTEQQTTPPAYTVLTQQQVCAERFPRRVGIPAKRPLF